MIGRLITHHKIIEELGSGGMGAVYKAEDTKLQRVVALKCLPPQLLSDEEAKQRFLQEALASSALNHPNIATIYYTFEDQGQEFICMEYIEGQTLTALMAKGRLPTGETIDIALQAADGLAEAHKKGIVHRDIKPDNIMITLRGLVKIMDFGLAKLRGSSGLTVAGSTLGTIAYMSPEQAQGRPVDHRADIFSLGVVLYEMLSGHRPFEGEYEAAILYAIQNEDPADFEIREEDVAPNLYGIIERALQKDPGDRYQSMDEMVTHLKTAKRVLEGTPAPTASHRAVETPVPTVPMDPEQLIGRTVGNYQITEKIGRGGMGIVYKALQISLNRLVALKVLPKQYASDPEFLTRFRREAKAAAALNHPNIIQIYDIDHQDEIEYFVMEYIEGTNLKIMIERDGALSLERAIDITWDTCKALDFAHKSGVVHRDIKPHNIMITNDGDTKVFDFGIAKAADSTGLTTTGTNIGTPQYMSPEQARGETGVDGRADLYSLGIVFYEMLVGKVPFEGTTAVGTMYRHVNEPPAPPSQQNPDVPPEIDNIVMKALAKDPDERYQSGQEMIQDLHEAKQALDLSITRAPEGESTGTKRRRAVPLVLGVFLIIALAAGAFYKLMGLFGSFDLSLDTDVPGALVYEEGRLLGSTPLKLSGGSLEPGDHLFLISMEGYADEVVPISIESGVPVEKRIVLSETFGLLTLVVAPPDANVIIDRAARGPPTDERYRLSPGMHEVTVERQGYTSRTDTVEITAGIADTLVAALAMIPSRLTLASNPVGASVSLDGERLAEQTPLSTEVEPGNRVLQISKNGYATVETTLSVRPGMPLEITLELQEQKRTPQYGSLRVQTTPPGAAVSLEGRFLGTSGDKTVFPQLLPQRYGVKLELEGYPPYEGTVSLRPNEEATLTHDFTATGSVNITCVDTLLQKPVFATVFIDGKDIGMSPLVVKDLFVGPHTVEIFAEGYNAATRPVVIKAEETVHLPFVLQPAP